MRNPYVIVVLVLLIVLLFGYRRLPDLARSIGSSLKVFKKEVSELTDDADAPRSTDQGTSTTSPASTTAPATPETSQPSQTSHQAKGPHDPQNT
ncbi:hypothetical protein GCM10009718_23680 [Isoptericola halotolerans]|uniref:Sec-independent protein translocase protein TatA n=1 Tax=Isoptericola halotolerans TaxID=300560 RepID=A0ABX2A5D4_9MICO|nr:sec-independent protein translocase protein TatA [Isoptericola halotolerans]